MIKIHKIYREIIGLYVLMENSRGLWLVFQDANTKKSEATYLGKMNKQRG